MIDLTKYQETVARQCMAFVYPWEVNGSKVQVLVALVSLLAIISVACNQPAPSATSVPGSAASSGQIDGTSSTPTPAPSATSVQGPAASSSQIDGTSSTPPLYLLTRSALEQVTYTDGSKRVVRWPLDSQYLTVQVDGDRVLLGNPGYPGYRFDLFRMADGSLDPLSSYSTDLRVGGFETRDGFLFLLVSGDDRAAFQIVNLNVNEGRRPELIATVDMKKAGHDIAVKGNYAYILDNIVFPFYLGIVDFSDPRHPVAEWTQSSTIVGDLQDRTLGRNGSSLPGHRLWVGGFMSSAF